MSVKPVIGGPTGHASLLHSRAVSSAGIATVAVSLWDRHAVGYLTTGRLFTCRRCIHAVGPQNSY
ncbi:hypothetical protein OFN29_29185, partial [Escherichia coli]|nr:hypothetical protein [Escherichia coli]